MAFAMGRKMRRYSVFVYLTWTGIVVVGGWLLLCGLAVFLSMAVQAPTWLLASLVGVSAAGAGGLWVLLRQPVPVWKRALIQRMADSRRATPDRRQRDGFTRSDQTPVPPPVGHVLDLGVSSPAGGGEIAVVRHGQRGPKHAYFSTVVEISGRGDGIRSDSAADRDDARVDRLLTELAEDQMPVNQLDMHVRALPGLSQEYVRQARAMLDPRIRGTYMGRNMEQKLANLGVTSDDYRSYAVVCMPETSLEQFASRHHRAVDRDTLTQAAFDVTGRVAERLHGAGFPVIRVLSPAGVGALIRHLYQPAWGIDDVRGITTVEHGFPARYEPPQRETLSVPDDEHDEGWWHVSGDVPPWGWPSRQLESRWMEPIVTQLYNAETKRSVVRTITSSFRLMTRKESNEKLQSEQYRAEVQRHHEKDRVSTGEDEEQRKDIRQQRADLAQQATGVRVASRITVSARSRAAVLDARDFAASQWTGMGVSEMRWHEGRQDAAMILGLPLGRGWR